MLFIRGFVLHEDCDTIKEHNKQKREIVHNLHYLKDSL